MHVLRLIDEQDRACLEVHVQGDRLQESVELFLRLYPGKRLWIDGTIVQLGGSAAPTAEGSSPSGAVAGMDVQGADPTLGPMATLLKLNSMMFAEHLECQRRLTDEMREQYRALRASLHEVDLMTRGMRVIEFQELLRGIQAMNASPHQDDAERKSWRNEQVERFLLGGLKATRLVKDA